MCGMRDNLEKYSILDPTKEDRKIIKRRSTDDVDDKDSVNQSSAPQVIFRIFSNNRIESYVPHNSSSIKSQTKFLT